MLTVNFNKFSYRWEIEMNSVEHLLEPLFMICSTGWLYLHFSLLKLQQVIILCAFLLLLVYNCYFNNVRIAKWYMECSEINRKIF